MKSTVPAYDDMVGRYMMSISSDEPEVGGMDLFGPRLRYAGGLRPGLPGYVAAVHLPFVVLKDPLGNSIPVDTRLVGLVEVSTEYAVAMGHKPRKPEEDIYGMAPMPSLAEIVTRLAQEQADVD